MMPGASPHLWAPAGSTWARRLPLRPPSSEKDQGAADATQQIAEHVAEAEIAYARKLGVRLGHDFVATRAALIVLLGTPDTEGTPTETRWPVRYGARRIAWHVLDHAWEIEDKS